MVDMLRCNGCHWLICSCAELVIGGYAQAQSWSLMDIVMCRVVNGGYAQVQWWSMVDMLTCRSDQLSICSCAVVLNGEYAHVEWWSMEGYAHVQ